MANWVRDKTYIGLNTELDYVYKRTIFKSNIFLLVEYVRIVKYRSTDYWYPVSPITGEIIIDNTNKPDKTCLFYNKAITFNNNNLNYKDKFVSKFLRLLIDRSDSIFSFDKIAKSKYMKLDFVGVIVRKHHKVFTRNEKLKDLGI